MPAAKQKPAKRAPTTNGVLPPAGDVLTLAEAAAYLRLPEAEVTRLVQTQGLPGRRAANEWRFLKSAIQAWLSAPTPKAGDGIWALAGSWKDDPDLDDMLNEIYRR